MSEISRPFANRLTSDEKYFRCHRGNLLQPIQIQLSQKLKILSENSTAFHKSTFDFKQFKKQMSIIAYVFPKL